MTLYRFLILLILFLSSSTLYASPVDVKERERKEVSEKGAKKKTTKKFHFFKKKKKTKLFPLFKKKHKKSKRTKRKKEIKNKWMRTSLRILVICLIALIIGMILFLIGFSNPSTFIGSDLVSNFSYILIAISLYLGIAALISLIITGIVLAIKG